MESLKIELSRNEVYSLSMILHGIIQRKETAKAMLCSYSLEKALDRVLKIVNKLDTNFYSKSKTRFSIRMKSAELLAVYVALDGFKIQRGEPLATFQGAFLMNLLASIKTTLQFHE